jgi:hypothetical protein
MEIQRVYIGGWFQRTTLHLTELWEFLKHGTSKLSFTEAELTDAHNLLQLTDVSRQSGPLEYLLIETSLGITYRIYEDGLMVLERKVTNLRSDCDTLRRYYDECLSKAISTIFSKGAPVPKELANIQTILPYIVTVEGATIPKVTELFRELEEEAYATLSSKSVQVYRASGLIVINNLKNEVLAREVIESQIFFREFKSQLHRYLTIHRVIWEKIAKIKEQGSIRGTNVDALRAQLSGYEKTITLIGARIDQMSAYLRTRQKLTDSKNVDSYLRPLFQFKFETLQDTHEYIKYLWDMTKSYLSESIEVINELQAKSTKSTIASLQLITTIGVVAAILGYLGRDQWPKFTGIGLVYFVLLLTLTWLINSVVSRLYKRKRYRIKGANIVTDIN